MSTYLLSIQQVQMRTLLTRFRLGVSCIQTHRLRFHRTTDSVKSCPFCPQDEESEVHFMLVCARYDDIRKRYIPLKFHRTPSSFKLALLMATTNETLLKNVAKYVFEAIQARNSNLP